MNKTDKEIKLTKEEFFKYTNEFDVIGKYSGFNIHCTDLLNGDHEFGIQIENESHHVNLETLYDLKYIWKIFTGEKL